MAAGVHLIGGGWTAEAAALVYGPFLREAGSHPRIGVLVIDEGDGPAQFARWSAVLLGVAPCRPHPLLVPIGEVFDPAVLDAVPAVLDSARPEDLDALLVCGGLTPAYATALGPAAAQVQSWTADRPYCGFSAGAAVAATSAVVGGWLVDGRPVIPEDAAEDLDEVTVVPGLGLVPFVVDVHAAQWGTLARLLTPARLTGRPGIALDEDTVLSVSNDRILVGGPGHAHVAVPSDGTCAVRRYVAGETIEMG